MNSSKAPFELAGVTDQRLAFVERWWRARRADLKLRQIDDDGEGRTRKVAKGSRFKVDLQTTAGQYDDPFNVDVGGGDVRLLSSSVLPNAHRKLIYVAVLTVYPQDGLCLIAPFSHYGSPATCGEWMTGHAGWPVRTLQLWNARTAPTALLAQSWRCFRMTAAERHTAMVVLQSITSGMILPEEIRERIGLPILKDDDPRIAYQDEERELFQPLTEAAEDVVQRSVQPLQSLNLSSWLTNSLDDLQMAAAGGPGPQMVSAPVRFLVGRDTVASYELHSKRVSFSFDPEEGWEVRWRWPLQRDDLPPEVRVVPGMLVWVFLKPDGKNWKLCMQCATEGEGHHIVCSGRPGDRELWNLMSGPDAQVTFVIQSIF